jgi:hypothetical protein
MADKEEDGRPLMNEKQKYPPRNHSIHQAATGAREGRVQNSNKGGIAYGRVTTCDPEIGGGNSTAERDSLRLITPPPLAITNSCIWEYLYLGFENNKPRRSESTCIARQEILPAEGMSLWSRGLLNE